MIEKNQKSAQRQLREWVSQRYSQTEVKTYSDVTDEAMEYFARDENFIDQLFREELREFFYNIVRSVAAYTRNGGANNCVSMGDAIISREEFDKRAEENYKKHTRPALSKWERWQEHAGGKVINLTALNEITIELAYNSRQSDVNSAVGYRDFIGELKEGLVEGSTVGDSFTDDEIQEIYDRTVGRIGGKSD